VRHLRQHMVALPIHQDLTPDDMSYIAEVVAECARRRLRLRRFARTSHRLTPLRNVHDPSRLMSGSSEL
jgi:hypothetical protein